ncbi:hypothetical protein ON010_g7916 [Phytophthora cinnamomi]|nr:hypothetical protein ON010_g7916 [Phytophthora cinnamomi]
MYPRGSYEWVAEYIPTKTAAEVESYGRKCWESEKYQRVLARRQQAEHETREFASRTSVNLPESDVIQPNDEVKIEQSSPMSSMSVEPAVKPHRLRKWLRATFRWCIEALAFRCLRRQRYYGAETVLGVDLPDNQATPTTSQHVDMACYRFAPVPIQGPMYQRCATTAAPEFSTGKASFSRSRGAFQQAPPLYEARRYPQEQHRAPPVYSRAARGYTSSAPPERSLTDFEALDADEDDDSCMRSARQAAAEIEWYDKVTEPEPANRVSKQNSGVWSKDEQERYYAGLEKYRYGSWKLIADHVGTRTERQVMSHAQSIRAKRKRAENRDPLKSNKNTRITSNAPGRSSPAEVRNPTLEELLVASLANPPVPTRSNSGHSESVPTIMANHPDANSTPGEIRLGVDFPYCGDGDEDRAGVQSAFRKGRGNASIPVSQPEKRPKPKAGVDPDSPLCSPPLDILRESGLSNESLLDLLDIPPTQAT